MFPRLEKFDGPIFWGGLLYTGGGRLIFGMLSRLHIWEAYIRVEGGGGGGGGAYIRGAC